MCAVVKVQELTAAKYYAGTAPHGRAVQAYVRDRILEFVEKPAFAKRLYMSSEDVREAAVEALTELARPGDATCTGSYKLVFRHSCLCAGRLPPRAAACRIVQAAVVMHWTAPLLAPQRPRAPGGALSAAAPVRAPGVLSAGAIALVLQGAAQVPKRAPTCAQDSPVCASCDSACHSLPELLCCSTR